MLDHNLLSIKQTQNKNPARDVFQAKLEFIFAENRTLFGLGSHESNNKNSSPIVFLSYHRGVSRHLYWRRLTPLHTHVFMRS